MGTQLTGSWSNTAWDEKEYDAKEGENKLVTVKMKAKYEGSLDGESTVDYLMVYCPDGTGVAVGLERFIGSVDGKQGSFTLKHDGTFTPKDVTMHAEIVKGSGTGALAGIQGSRSEVLAGHGPYPYDYTVSFE